MSETVAYKEIAHYKDEKFNIVVQKPILTPEEYERRHKLLEKACRDILIEQIEAHAKKEKEEVV